MLLLRYTAQKTLIILLTAQSDCPMTMRVAAFSGRGWGDGASSL